MKITVFRVVAIYALNLEEKEGIDEERWRSKFPITDTQMSNALCLSCVFFL